MLEFERCSHKPSAGGLAQGGIAGLAYSASSCPHRNRMVLSFPKLLLVSSTYPLGKGCCGRSPMHAMYSIWCSCSVDVPLRWLIREFGVNREEPLSQKKKKAGRRQKVELAGYVCCCGWCLKACVIGGVWFMDSASAYEKDQMALMTWSFPQPRLTKTERAASTVLESLAWCPKRGRTPSLEL